MRHRRIQIFALCLCLVLAACVSATPSGLESTDFHLTTPSAVVITQIPAPSPTLNITPEGTWIRLQPDAGIPGTVVHIDGYFPGGLPQKDLKSQDYTTYASICWDGCQTGLEEDGLEVAWSRTEPGHFSLEFTVPPIPWLAVDGFHPLEAGDYPIDLINLDPSKIGCDTPNGCPVTPNASAIFHVTQSAIYPSCKEPNCGSLVASPAEAAPGEHIQVNGWAPLVQFVGEPFGYNLVLEPQGNTSPENVMMLAVQQSEVVHQAMDGSLTASFQVPQYGNNGSALDPGNYTLALEAPLTSRKNTFPILVAPTTFKISAAPTWVLLPHPHTLWIQSSADLEGTSLATDPLNPDHLAHCAPGEIQLSQDSGRNWINIPVNHTSLQSPNSQLTIADQQPTCLSVTLDSTHPGSLYAVFSLVDKDYGAPPIYFVGYYTTDWGKNWNIAPVPSIEIDQQTIIDNFGGFWTDGKAVQVLYYGKPGIENQPFPLLAKQTVDGGSAWIDTPLVCPYIGPCARWGAAPGMVSGMGADMPQSVLSSQDGGKTWLDTGQSVELRMIGPHELVALYATDLLLISGTNRFPLRYSADGGMNWQVIALPSIPNNQTGWFEGYPGLQMMPDGSLLTMHSDTGQWMRLYPTAQDWCLTSFTSTNLSPEYLRFTSDRVWWYSDSSMELQSAPQSEFDCP